MIIQNIKISLVQLIFNNILTNIHDKCSKNLFKNIVGFASTVNTLPNKLRIQDLAYMLFDLRPISG